MVDVVDHGRGFFSGRLFSNPIPVDVDGVVMHKCLLVETEQMYFQSHKSAFDYFYSNFDSLISQSF